MLRQLHNMKLGAARKLKSQYPIQSKYSIGKYSALKRIQNIFFSIGHGVGRSSASNLHQPNDTNH